MNKLIGPHIQLIGQLWNKITIVYKRYFKNYRHCNKKQNDGVVFAHLYIVWRLVQTWNISKIGSANEFGKLSKYLQIPRALKDFGLKWEIEGSTNCDAALSSLKVNRHFTFKIIWKFEEKNTFD